MPETEPTPWELMRVLREVQADVKRVVTRTEFDAESRRVDAKLEDLSKDIAEARVEAEKRIAEEKAERIGAVAAARADMEKQVVAEQATREKHEKAASEKQDKSQNNIRWLAASLILPVALFVANLLASRGA